ncbi:hypothetical protein ES703_36772 [subsurface metagenome]
MISEPYNYILKKSNDIQVSRLQSDLKVFLNESFEALRPLSYKYKEVCNMRDDGNSEYLCIGTWLRTKWGRGRGYGSHVDSIVPYILNYGDELKPHVRRPIKDDFADIVDLTKKLKKYENREETLTVSPRKLFQYNMSWHEDYLEVSEKEVEVLSLSTKYPKNVEMISENDENPWNIGICYKNSPAVIEDIIDDVVRLYDRVDAKLAVVRDYNQQIMSQIDQIVTPYKLLKAFK